MADPEFMGSIFDTNEKETLLRMMLALRNNVKRFKAMFKDYIQVVNMKRDKEALLGYML